MRYILVQLCNANASKCLRPAWPAQVVAEAFQKRSWKLGLLGGHLVQPKNDLPEVSLYKEPAGSSPSSTRGDPTKRCIQHHGAFGVKSTPSDWVRNGKEPVQKIKLNCSSTSSKTISVSATTVVVLLLVVLLIALLKALLVIFLNSTTNSIANDIRY